MLNVQAWGEATGVLNLKPGGFDPGDDIGVTGASERGDPFYVVAPRAKAKGEKTMAPKELQAAHQRLGLSAGGAAKVFGVYCGKTVRRWYSGESPAPLAVIRLTEILLESPEARRVIGVDLKSQ